MPEEQDTKYDLGLPFLAAKWQKIKKAELINSQNPFMTENKGFFGFIPLSDMPPKIEDLSRKSKLSYIDMHKRLRKDGRPNFSGLQIAIKSKLNADKFAHYLQGYWDWQLPL